jgi:hypothetical protein
MKTKLPYKICGLIISSALVVLFCYHFFFEDNVPQSRFGILWFVATATLCSLVVRGISKGSRVINFAKIGEFLAKRSFSEYTVLATAAISLISVLYNFVYFCVFGIRYFSLLTITDHISSALWSMVFIALYLVAIFIVIFVGNIVLHELKWIITHKIKKSLYDKNLIAYYSITMLIAITPIMAIKAARDDLNQPPEKQCSILLDGNKTYHNLSVVRYLEKGILARDVNLRETYFFPWKVINRISSDS